MTQGPCWSDLESGRILKPDAEEIADHVFRAVHCTTELQIADTADGNRLLVSPEELVSRFLDPRRDYVQAVVLGESGTGKSHLIQWLRLHIPQDDETTVLLTIPKTGTSLRGIVDRLIARLPVDERGVYEDRLKLSGTQATSQAAKVSKFLDSLAWAIEHGGAANAEDRDLAALLPDVLRDPNFRSGFFLASGSTVEAIVEHVFVDPANRDGSEERREFHLGDLPLDGKRYNDASRNAQEAIDYIKGEAGMDMRAIGLMNLNLNAAIAQTLNLSADDLIELMNTLRRHLAMQGKRLILLIEDFARLQGIDTAMLQALITPPGQGDERLCELRWAMAVTTGYFKTLEQTVRTRTTFVVDMDLSKPASLTSLTAGYLNALRLGEKKLQALSPSEPVPSGCDQCDKRLACLPAFGDIEGIGLFPFTETAINVMAIRSESLTAEGNFNPRQYLRIVLEGVLVRHYQDLEHAEFPSDALLKRIGGINALKPIDRQRLEQADGVHYSRRNSLLELWTGQDQIVNLPKGIHEAFGIPLLDDISTPTPTPTIGHNPTPQRAPQSGQTVTPEIEAVRHWASDNAMMSQTLTSELRELVFMALESFVDWDELGYKKAMVASATSRNNSIPFRQVSINFTNQQTQDFASFVTLKISTDAALALEALLMQKFHGSWDFPDSGPLLANLLECLRTWGASVVKQLEDLYGGQENWSPATACAELLLIATLQGAKVKVGDSQLETVVARMWEANAPKTLQSLHAPFEKLNTRLIAAWPKLVEILRSISSGTKGGQARNFLRITPALKAVRTFRQNSLQLTQTPPGGSLPKDLKDLAELYQRLQAEFQTSVVEEKAAWSQWLVTVQESIQDDTTVQSLVQALKVTIDDAVNQGINAGGSRGKLDQTLVDINPPTLDRALTHVRALGPANMTDSLIRLASIGDAKESIDRLLSQADTFLQQSEAAITNERSRFEEQSGSGLKESESRIEKSLNQLSNSLGALNQLPGASA